MIDMDHHMARALRRAGFPSWAAVYDAGMTEAKMWLTNQPQDDSALLAAFVERAIETIRVSVDKVLSYLQDELESSLTGFDTPRSFVRDRVRVMVDKMRTDITAHLDHLHRTLTDAAADEAGRFDRMGADFLAALERP
ncbi:hypothetical protein [Azospirillum argentinense]|uniref:Uncharacterized protein n=1 Tax=Azospirillum argentinense TaxID=2970906 RepID=A0A5B0KQB2_9PROT|nr:hypothetical protein [Azospirillum argentinense]KAA1052954.1 hypothetical protein FH063_003361 [Azospirillum argentinense]